MINRGDVGVIPLAHPGRDGIPPGYTVEVTTVTGETVAIVDVAADAVRPATEEGIWFTLLPIAESDAIRLLERQMIAVAGAWNRRRGYPPLANRQDTRPQWRA